MLRLERDEWSIVERRRQEVTIKCAPPPTHTPWMRVGNTDYVVYIKRVQKGRNMVYDRKNTAEQNAHNVEFNTHRLPLFLGVESHDLLLYLEMMDMVKVVFCFRLFCSKTPLMRDPWRCSSSHCCHAHQPWFSTSASMKKE